MCGGNDELILQQKKQEEVRIDIREQLTSMQHWDDAGGGETVDQKRTAYAERLIRQEMENTALVNHILESLEVSEADEATEGTPQTDMKPVKKSWKKRQEEKNRAKEARKQTPVGDYTSYCIHRDVTRKLQEKSNSVSHEIEERIRSNQGASMDSRVVNAFLKGHRTDARGMPADEIEAQKKAEDEQFLHAYTAFLQSDSSEEGLNHRRPFLKQITMEMINLEIRMEMFTDDYLCEHAGDLMDLAERMTCFENIMKDPLNEPFFQQELEPYQKELLDARWKTLCGPFGMLLQSCFAKKGVRLNNGSYLSNQDHIQGLSSSYEADKRNLQAALEESRQKEQSAMEHRLDAVMNDARKQLLEEYDLDAEEIQKKGFQFTSRYQSGYIFSEMERCRSMIEHSSVTFAEHQDVLKRLYQQLYRQYDVLSDTLFELNAASAVSTTYFNDDGFMGKVARLADSNAENLHLRHDLILEQINGTVESIKFYTQGGSLSERARKELERIEYLEDAERLQEKRDAEQGAVDLFTQAESQYEESEQKERETEEAVEEAGVQQRVENCLKTLHFGTDETLTSSDFTQALNDKAIKAKKEEYIRRQYHRDDLEETFQNHLNQQGLRIDLSDLSIRNRVLENLSGTRIRGIQFGRTMSLLKGALGGSHTSKELALTYEKLLRGARYQQLKENQSALTQDEAKELSQYEDDMETLQRTVDEGIREMKQLQLDQLRRLRDKYGRYGGQLHPEDFMERAGQEFTDDFALLQDALHMLSDGREYFEENGEDEEFRNLVEYYNAVYWNVQSYVTAKWDSNSQQEEYKRYDKKEFHTTIRNLEHRIGGEGFNDEEQAAYEETVRQRVRDGASLQVLGRFKSQEMRDAEARAEAAEEAAQLAAAHLLTRQEAANTHSDQLSEERRRYVNGLAKRFDKDSSVRQALESYYKGTRYEVGYTEERRRLKAAINAVEQEWSALTGEEQQAQGSKSLRDARAYFAEMTNGTLIVPEDAEVQDFSMQRPTEQGTIQRGSRRNALIRGFSYWSDQKDTPLFSHEPTVNDLKQRMVSNCYMVAGTAGLVNIDPALLKECIKENDDHTVTVRLYETYIPEEERQREADSKAEIEQALLDLQQKIDNGEVDELDADSQELEIRKEQYQAKRSHRPVYVKVSKEIPRIAGADTLSAGALWMQMIEKACAFVGRNGVKGYKSLWYGEGGGFLERLLGVEPEQVGTTDADQLFHDICNCQQNRMVYHAGTGGGVGAKDGLNAGHAYTVMGGRQVGSRRLVLLRNPYSTMSLEYQENGQKTRTGRHLDTSSDETYGQFYMEFEEFLQKFQTITRTDLSKAQRNPGAA